MGKYEIKDLLLCSVLQAKIFCGLNIIHYSISLDFCWKKNWGGGETIKTKDNKPLFLKQYAFVSIVLSIVF